MGTTYGTWKLKLNVVHEHIVPALAHSVIPMRPGPRPQRRNSDRSSWESRRRNVPVIGTVTLSGTNMDVPVTGTVTR